MSKFVTITSHKSRRTALVLCIVGGFFGLHRFYVGRWGSGLLFAISAGGFIFGWLHDLSQILHGTFKDNNGMPLIQW